MSALTKESRERLFLAGRITAKHTPVKHKPSSPRRKTATEDSYHQDALEAFHNDALSRDQLDYLRRKATQRANGINKEVCKLNLEAVHKPSASQSKQGKCKSKVGTRSSAASGDSNSADGNGDDGEPPRPLLFLQLYDQASLALILKISKKTLQNLYSTKPHTLPVAIHVPGARGPRWTPASISVWLEQRPQHTPKPKPVSPVRKVGRPRIAAIAALRSAGSAS
ncbi:MAG: hypothetical protein ACYCUY_09750 [Acidithiobacillus sp.]